LANETLEIVAHAKVNWTLDIFDKRDDGYHEMASVMQRIELADKLRFFTRSSGIRLTITGPEADGVPSDEKNIVVKAAKLLGVDGVEIVVEKQIPNQAGLGGGSSDAASALIGLNEIFSLGLSNDEFFDAAKALGADVSFFLAKSTAKVGGFGEIVTPIQSGPSIDLVIIKPEAGVSTVAAYMALDQIPNRVSHNGTAAWPDSEPTNDFEEVVYSLYPEVGEARRALISAGATGTLLCGSGAAVMGWGDNLSTIVDNLQNFGIKKLWLTRTLP